MRFALLYSSDSSKNWRQKMVKSMGNLFRKDQSGFTITELVIAVGIGAVLAGIAIPALSSWAPKYRLKRAARDVFSNFQLAKMTAIKENKACTITFNQDLVEDGNTHNYDYVVFVDSDEDAEYDSGERIETKVDFSKAGPGKTNPYLGISFDTSEGGGDGLTFLPNNDGLPSIAFKPDGLPYKNTLSGLGLFGVGTVFLMNSEGDTKKVVLASAGRIRIE